MRGGLKRQWRGGEEKDTSRNEKKYYYGGGKNRSWFFKSSRVGWVGNGGGSNKGWVLFEGFVVGSCSVVFFSGEVVWRAFWWVLGWGFGSGQEDFPVAGVLDALGGLFSGGRGQGG